MKSSEKRDLSRRGVLKASLAGTIAGAAAMLPEALWAQPVQATAPMPAKRTPARPNIVLIMPDDVSPHFSCYGETTIRTPNLDRLASQGALFTRAFTTSPVCSPARSGAMTGCYPTTIGAHHHRSSVPLPAGVKLLPELFQQAGYYTCIGDQYSLLTYDPDKKRPFGKTDYNVPFKSSVYDDTDWAGRKPGQPFFAQVQLMGGKDRPAKVANPVDPGTVHLPPYYPDHPVLREDWAGYLNTILSMDIEVGKVLKRLEEEGIADQTIVVFMADHGISHIRDKQFLYEGGIHIPMIIRAPGVIAPGTVLSDLLQQIDVSATLLELAGIEIPAYMEGRPLIGPKAKPRDYIIAARDRCDETEDRIRCVRTERFKYIRNYHPELSHTQPNAYKDRKLIMKTMRQLYAEGKLNEDQGRVFLPTRPPEELYDLQQDPWEMKNLAADEAHQQRRQELAAIMDRWIKDTDDKGQYPEPSRPPKPGKSAKSSKSTSAPSDGD